MWAIYGHTPFIHLLYLRYRDIRYDEVNSNCKHLTIINLLSNNKVNVSMFEIKIIAAVKRLRYD